MIGLTCKALASYTVVHTLALGPLVNLLVHAVLYGLWCGGQLVCVVCEQYSRTCGVRGLKHHKGCDMSTAACVRLSGVRLLSAGCINTCHDVGMASVDSS